MTNDQLDQIIAGLSEAQRRSIRMFRQSACGKNWHCPVYRDAGQMAKSLREAKIISRKGIATNLGKAVRSRLLEMNDE